MKKNDFRKLALMGLATGLLVSESVNAAEDAKTKETKPAKEAADSSTYNPNDENSTYHLMTEDELLLELNEDGVKLYNSLDPKGKELARFVASQSCNGTNTCKGLNACQTDKNPCAGKGECKGLSKCAFSDKNLAVKVVAEKIKMADKRNNLK